MSYNNNTHHCQNDTRENFSHQTDTAIPQTHRRSARKDERTEKTEQVQRLYKDFLNNL